MASEEKVNKPNLHQKLKEDFRFPIGLVGLSLMGTWYPPLLLLSAAGVCYYYWPIFQGFQQDLKKKRITTNLFDVLVITILLIIGKFVVATMFTLTTLLTLKLQRQAEDHSRQQLANVFGLQPQSVWLIQNDMEVEVPLEKVQKGDFVVVNV